MALVHNAAYYAAAARLKARNATLAGSKLSQSPAFMALAGQTPGSGLAGSKLARSPAFAALAAQQAASRGTPPAAAGGSPNGDVSAPSDDFRDSSYGAGLAALLGQVQAQRQAVAAADQTDQQNYNENLTRLADQRGKTLDSTLTTANQQGLLYSGILGQRQGDVNASYDDQQNQQREALTGRQAARQAQLQQIGNLSADASSPYGYSATGDAGTSFYNLLRDAADRRVNTVGTDPVAPGAIIPDAAAPAATAAPRAVAAVSARQMAARNPAMKARVKARVLAGKRA